MRFPFSEKQLSDHLKKHLSELPSLIVNPPLHNNPLDEGANRFSQLILANEDVDSVLLQLALERNRTENFSRLYDLELCSPKFLILDTGVSGFKPSIDILAINPIMGTLVVFELKRSEKTERELATELNAYTLGLQRRVWGAQPADIMWVPICTDWRTMPRAAMTYEALYKGANLIPLRAQLAGTGASLKDLRLEVLQLDHELPDDLAHSVFAVDAYDSYLVSIDKEPEYPDDVLSWIVSQATKHGYTGFAFYVVSNRSVDDPFQFVFAAFNPFRACLKRSHLAVVRKYGEDADFRDAIENDVPFGFDYDFSTGEQVEVDLSETFNDPDEKKNDRAPVSTSDLAWVSANRLSALFVSLQEYLNVSGYSPHFDYHEIGLSLREYSYFTPQTVRKVAYFGLLQEAHFELIRGLKHCLTSSVPETGKEHDLYGFELFRLLMGVLGKDRQKADLLRLLNSNG